jgi:hypothetical protein
MILFEKLPEASSKYSFYQKGRQSNGQTVRNFLKSWTYILFAIALFFSSGPVFAMDLTLAWDTHPSAKGYKIHYKSGSSGPPYNGTGAAEGDSPIDVGWVSEFTLRGLPDDEVYYVSLTAYKNNTESGYSNEVTTARGVADSSSSSGLSGGGDSGCFISTIFIR